MLEVGRGAEVSGWAGCWEWDEVSGWAGCWGSAEVPGRGGGCWWSGAQPLVFVVGAGLLLEEGPAAGICALGTNPPVSRKGTPVSRDLRFSSSG